MMNGYGMDGWAWYWMVPTMVFWVIVFAGIVYGAVRLALQHERGTARRQ